MSLDNFDDIKAMGDDQVLDFTQRWRVMMINKLTNNGQALPMEAKDVAALDGVLSSLDRQALGKKRIKVEEKGNKNAEEGMKLISAVLGKIGSNDVFAGVTGDKNIVRETIPASYEELDLVPGELDIGITDMKYEDFVKEDEKT